MTELIGLNDQTRKNKRFIAGLTKVASQWAIA